MKYKLSDVVDRINGNVDRFTTSLEYYVGGEHFESNELEITGCGLIKPNVNILGFKFHFAFQPGDVLYMARNPHLRKAGMVNFSGICSDASYILRTKDSNVLCQEYLAVIMQSNHLWDYCESHKVGSVNFAINWKTLANYEFDLPDINIQRSIANRIWAAYRVKQAYKKLISATDEMVKSQFIEWFGNVTETTSLSSLIAESYPGEWGKEAKNNNGVKVLRTTNFQNNGHIDYSDVIVRYIEQKKIEKKCLRTGDIILERSGGTKDNPVGRVVLFEAEGEYMFNNFTQLLRPIKSVNPYYLFFYLHTSYNADKASMRAMASQTTGIQNLNMTDYMAKEIPLPSLEEQEQFERLYRQADKSKFDGFKSRFIEWFGNAIQSVPLEDVVEILDNKRKPLNDSQRSGMKSGQLYPYYGATGVVDYVNAFLTDEDLICLAEDCGAYGPGEQSSYIIEGKAWVNNHAHVLRAKDNVILKYLQFFFTLTDLNEFISGTTRKKLTQSALKKIKVTLPDIELQELFVAIAEQADKSKYYEINET